MNLGLRSLNMIIEDEGATSAVIIANGQTVTSLI